MSIHFDPKNHENVAVPASETREAKISRLVGDYKRTVLKDFALQQRYINLLKEAGIQIGELDRFFGTNDFLVIDLKRALLTDLKRQEVLSREMKVDTTLSEHEGKSTSASSSSSTSRTDEVRDNTLPDSTSESSGDKK